MQWLKCEYECKNHCNRLFHFGSQHDTGSIGIRRKTLGCFCCLSGPIIAQARIDRAGYVPSQIIILNADTENESGIYMRGSKFESTVSN